MSILHDLQIHSDNQNVEHTLNLDPVEDQTKEKIVYIGQDNAKMFMITSSLCLFLLFVPAFSITCYAAAKGEFGSERRDQGSALLRLLPESNGKIKDVYFKFGLIVFLVAVILTALVKPIARSPFKFIFLFTILGFGGYISIIFYANQQFSQFNSFISITGNLAEVTIIYLILFNASFANLIVAILANRKPKIEIGFAVSLIMFVAEYLLFNRLADAFNLNFIEALLYGILQASVAGYYSLDLKFMMTHRYDLYQVNDWLLGFAHLMTDFTFRFWYNLFVKRSQEDLINFLKETNMKSVNKNVIDMDAKTAATKSTPQSDDENDS